MIISYDHNTLIKGIGILEQKVGGQITRLYTTPTSFV
jgi:hypothetical protein